MSDDTLNVVHYYSVRGGYGLTSWTVEGIDMDGKRVHARDPSGRISWKPWSYFNIGRGRAQRIAEAIVTRASVGP